MRRPTAIAVLLVSMLGCSSQPTPEERLAGRWRAVLDSPGGPLPFTLRIFERQGELAAVAINGEEEAPFSHVRFDDGEVELATDWYDSEIRASLEDVDGGRLRGRWRKTSSSGDSVLPFAARRDDLPGRPPAPRFESWTPPEPPASGTPSSVAGAWAILFTDDDGPMTGRGELRQEGGRVTGTILTPLGDYRYLEGSYEQGRLRLSTFDGAHAFLFDGQATADGTMAGEFWSRDSYRAVWRARPIADDQEVLPDAWTQVGLTNDQGRFSFSFPDLDGRPVSLDDERFRDKVVLVNIFGSWCPNCNDKAPVLADWRRRYRDRGLEIVGLAYELTGDRERDGRQVRRFAERHGVEFPLLLAGLSDKRKAAATLPDLSAVVAFPTTVFIGRDGLVRRIHTGFAGPGTGEHHRRLLAELEAAIESLLVEPASS